MNIILHDELRAYIDPLTEHEYAALERSLLTEGCRDALILWGDVLIDGHNRYAICQKHQLPFKTVQNGQFQNIEDVQLWMIENHLARRSVSDFQRGMLALRKKEILISRQQSVSQTVVTTSAPEPAEEVAPVLKTTQSRQEIARLAGISSHAVVQIEKIQRAAAPELVQAVRAGTISISAAAAIASLPEQEQASAVAGGRKELQQLARQAREKQREQKSPRKTPVSAPAGQDRAEIPREQIPEIPEQSEINHLRQKIQVLEEENTALHAQIQQLNLRLSAAASYATG
ncbi:ParB N-terminal domain-containing protein [Undibacterium oligocarboniphilum]|uniref:Plasmid replication/partition related protein n=1 Tax=Undibacterium oligocarboniphilum TaxID=666702 RepID=A0A850QI66_9BURK|nr:hypothetical protein [Undibacterium oligocarboniphilum]MBC3869113.1 hypothetical protein [Undibacterium oligocarboniphilum]NVO77093.1 hypothetical protein [Undibacterium oligocarboniphilum]